MRMILYSGGDAEDNHELDCHLKKWAGSNAQITYIPASSWEDDLDFSDFVTQYRAHGFHRFIHLPVDVAVDPVLIREALKSDIIYLGGGNTFYFLTYLRRSGLLREFKGFLARGGILTGMSAGAIILTPSIATATFPAFDRDVNHEKIQDLKACKLAPFEFFPHFRNSARYDVELRKHSKRIPHPLYACSEGAGIIMDGDKLTFVGQVFCFFQGKKFVVKGNSKAAISRK